MATMRPVTSESMTVSFFWCLDCPGQSNTHGAPSHSPGTSRSSSPQFFAGQALILSVFDTHTHTHFSSTAGGAQLQEFPISTRSTDFLAETGVLRPVH